MARTSRTRLCECGRAVRKRRGAKYCSPCVTKLGKRHCQDCGLDFAPDMMANGLRCKGCQRARLRAARVEKVYSITEDQYQKLLAHQGGKCFICHKRPGAKRLAVDHDHSCCAGPTSCGQCVRGLLCRQCNRDVLGNLKDSVAALYRAIDYLEDWPARRALRNLTECDDDTTLITPKQKGRAG